LSVDAPNAQYVVFVNQRREGALRWHAQVLLPLNDLETSQLLASAMAAPSAAVAAEDGWGESEAVVATAAAEGRCERLLAEAYSSCEETPGGQQCCGHVRTLLDADAPDLCVCDVDGVRIPFGLHSVRSRGWT